MFNRVLFLAGFFMVGTATLALQACSHQEGGDSATVLVNQSRQFGDLFELERTIAPEVGDASPLVRVSGIDFDATGNFVVSDASEGNIKLFRPDGRLIRVVGRKGDGPGEMRAPRSVRFGEDGTIHVLDVQRSTISRFSSDGDFEGRIQLNQFSPITAMEVNSSGEYVIAANSLGQSEDVVFVIGPDGVVRRSMLPLADYTPDPDVDQRLWEPVTSYHMRLRNDTAYVAHTLAAESWRVDTATGEIVHTTLDIDGYEAPYAPEGRFASIKDMMAWSGSFHTATSPLVFGDAIALPFVKGVLNYGDPLLVAVNHRGSGWMLIEDAPPLIGAWGDRVVTIVDPMADDIQFGLYRLRDR